MKKEKLVIEDLRDFTPELTITEQKKIKGGLIGATDIDSSYR